MARSRSSSPTTRSPTATTFDATSLIWPTLQVAKECPRRRRRTVYKDAGGRGASTRTATCPPLGPNRAPLFSRRSSVTRRSSRSPSPRHSRQARPDTTPRTTRVLKEAPWNQRRSSREGAGNAVTLAEVEAVSEADCLAAEAEQEAQFGKKFVLPQWQEDEEVPEEEAEVDEQTPANTTPAKAPKPDDGGATVKEPEELKTTSNPRTSLDGKGCSTKKRTSFASRSSLAGFNPPNNFADWLDSRPAMLRLGTQHGTGWEFPMSKSDMRELLVLNLAAENRVQSMQLEIQNEHIEQLEETVEA